MRLSPEDRKEFLQAILQSEAAADKVLDDMVEGRPGAEPIDERQLEAAMYRRRLRKKGVHRCIRCEANSPCGDQWTNPQLCTVCVSEVTDIQEEAYSEGRTAFQIGEPRSNNPYTRTGLEMRAAEAEAIRNAHWDSGWTDARQDD